jgi:hypothetical protein
MDLGQEIAEITAGIDRVYRSGSGTDGVLDREGLIPVAVAEVAPRPLRDWSEAEAALAGFRDRLSGADVEPSRRDWLHELAQSLVSLVAMFSGRPVRFADRLRDQLRVDTTLIPDRVLDGYRADLRAALDALGWQSGDLAADVAAWEAAETVPGGQVLAVLSEYQTEARRRSAAMVFDIADGWLAPVGEHDRPYAAYCDYPGRRLLLNLDFTYTRGFLKHLACHEAFPGHLVHLARREALVAEGRMPLEGAQVVTNSASSALFEGIADNGLELLDWIDGPQDHAALAIQRLRSALRCNAAWMVHAEGRSLDETIAVIAPASFQDAATTRRRLAFLSHELRAPFVYAYWCGDDAVRRFLEATKDADRGTVLALLYDRMQTPATLLKCADRLPH